ncbi:MAG: hypothetical protein A2Y57_03320 [Candidatus Woykebacteria bacterium RBG_13_40_7b]|uniref:Uncharacterized protein n=1 Tax=Candidatus Woykebacteria bacterium RBG_13_40_7b TaxID=1802594 RepID=A0A1G1WA40_9BACT|nr:MAG: hypothetical protein A2Y57_03320 [Candidatus Woykebacteria bacterium RBG_13_40_7b]
MSSTSGIQLDFSTAEVVKDQQGHILVDEQGNLACTDHNCRLKVSVEELAAAMIHEGRADLVNIARLAFANEVVHVGVDEYDPSVIHSQWIALYRKWGFSKEMRVPKPTFTREKVVEMAGLEEPRVPFYRHPKITLEMLNERFPAMRGHWSLQPNSGVVDNYELEGWMFLEATLEAPFCNTNQQQLEELAKANGWKGQTLVTYLLFGQYCKELHDRYPDLETWVRLLSSSKYGRVLRAHFSWGGEPYVRDNFEPSYVNSDLGGRFAVVA